MHQGWQEFLQKYDGLNILAPRNHLKTFFLFEAYSLQKIRFAKNPIEIRYFSATDGLAIERLDHIKDWLKLPYFQELREKADIDNRKEIKFDNGCKISVQGFWSKLRGGHPDILILDDVIDSQVIYSDEQNKKAKERLASEILPMAGPRTQIIIVGTLQREDDIYSVEWDKGSEKRWISKIYDAIIDEEKKITLFPEKWSWEQLMNKKKEITELSGEKWFLKEYRNMAVQLIGEIIKPEWKRTYKFLPKDLSIFSGWDLSVGKNPDKGDYTAKVTFGIDGAKVPNIYIIDVFRARMDFGKRVEAIIEHGEREDPIRIAVEDNVFQADTVQQAKSNSYLPIVGVKTTKNKIEKYNQELVPLFSQGRVFLKEGDEMQELFWKELCSLPAGSFDDMSDSFCVGLKGIFSRWGKSTDIIR